MSPSRRQFLLGATAVAGLYAKAEAGTFRYVVGSNSIDVFRMERGRATQIQRVPSAHPAFVALDSARKFLFAVNAVNEYDGLPRGSVESYAVHASSGYLQLVSRQPLSLSATMPRHFAISPSDSHLVVAAFGGGAYNVFPIGNGELGAVTQILKEIGRSVHPQKQASAHPHSVIFHPSGDFLFGSDSGSDRVNVFGFRNGRLTRLDQVAAPPGSRPAQLSLTADGADLSVRHEVNDLLLRYRFEAATGCLAALRRRLH